MPEEKYDGEEYKTMINDCFNRKEKMSDWECKFMSTCLNMVDKDIMLSHKQRPILEEIWDKVTS